MGLDPNEKKSNSIRRGLILVLLGLQLGTVLLIIFISYFSSDRDINAQISVLLKNALSESKEHAQGFLEPSYRTAKASAELFSKEIIDIRNAEEIEEYFLSQLAVNPEMTGIYVATVDGGFRFVSRSKGDEAMGFMTKIITPDKPGKASFYFRDENLVKTEEKLDQNDQYIASKRPWYQKAIDKKDLVWTDPYIFYTSNKPGITVSTPFYNGQNELLGVVGIDLELTSISLFLSDLKIYGSALVSMVSGSGKFVATPSLSEESVKLNALDVETTNHDNFNLEKIAVSHYLQQSDRDNVNFSSEFVFEDEAYAIRFEPLLLNNGPEWIITAYAPKKSFLENIRIGENRNTIIAIVILLVSLIVGFILIRKTWQPFEHFFHDVVTDQLTGLFNRRFLENIGSRMYIRLLREQHDFISVALIDLDFFSKTNVEFGESTASHVLVEFADFLNNIVRPEDIITRYSGDTFVIIFPGLDNVQAVKVVDRMRYQLDSWPLSVDNLLVTLSFSAGVETIDKDNCAEDAAFTDFIDRARLAMKEAKSRGRDRVVSAKTLGEAEEV